MTATAAQVAYYLAQGKTRQWIEEAYAQDEALHMKVFGSYGVQADPNQKLWDYQNQLGGAPMAVSTLRHFNVGGVSWDAYGSATEAAMVDTGMNVRSGSVYFDPMDGRSKVVQDGDEQMNSGGMGIDGSTQALRQEDLGQDQVDDEDDYVEALYD